MIVVNDAVEAEVDQEVIVREDIVVAMIVVRVVRKVVLRVSLRRLSVVGLVVVVVRRRLLRQETVRMRLLWLRRTVGSGRLHNLPSFSCHRLH
jgi:hypothetical protein